MFQSNVLLPSSEPNLKPEASNVFIVHDDCRSSRFCIISTDAAASLNNLQTDPKLELISISRQSALNSLYLNLNNSARHSNVSAFPNPDYHPGLRIHDFLPYCYKSIEFSV
jgi:hypothetical protein